MPEISTTRLEGQSARPVQANDSTGTLSPLTGEKGAKTAIRCDRLIAAACLMKRCGGKRRQQGGDAEVRNEKASDRLR